jgi:hypothetical protein
MVIAYDKGDAKYVPQKPLKQYNKWGLELTFEGKKWPKVVHSRRSRN